MKFSTSTLILFPFLAASCVSAHGILRRISIQGKVFEGNRVGGPTNPSVIRQVNSQDPNKGANNPALTCGPGSGPASLVADANPGDTITFDWRSASDGLWPHNIGPMLTYMASCGSVTCDKFNQADAQWFKIDQVGRKSNSADWVQDDLKNGGVASVRIPADLAPGNYLIRHDIIALHLGTSVGGAEFYPGCAQLKVGGSGSGVPKASELVKFPGAYSDNDPGIFDPNVFNAGAPYVMPGPAVAALVTGGAPAGTPATPTPTPTPSASSSTSSQSQPSPTSSKKKCIKKKKVAAPSATPSSSSSSSEYKIRREEQSSGSSYLPRRISHIMRRMSFESLH